MSPRLNAEILFDVGKKLIEDGDSVSAIKFALSGKEPFEAMKRVFAAATTIKLYDGYYFVGWENKCCKFEHERNNPSFKFLMNQIGNRVDKLLIDCKETEFYQVIIDKISEKKKLTSFSSGINCCEEFLDQFLPQFSATLKHVKIPSYRMTETFRDTFNLESLIVVNYGLHDFSEMCCKTEQLEIQRPPNALAFNHLVIKGNIEHRSSVKRIIFSKNGSLSFHNGFNELMKNFSSLEVLQYNFAYPGAFRTSYKSFIQNLLIYFMMFYFNNADKVPSKIVFKFKNSDPAANRLEDLDFYKELCGDLEFDESNKSYYSFCRPLESFDGTDPATILELQFSK